MKLWVHRWFWRNAVIWIQDVVLRRLERFPTGSESFSRTTDFWTVHPLFMLLPLNGCRSGVTQYDGIHLCRHIHDLPGRTVCPLWSLFVEFISADHKLSVNCSRKSLQRRLYEWFRVQHAFCWHTLHHAWIQTDRGYTLHHGFDMKCIGTLRIIGTQFGVARLCLTIIWNNHTTRPWYESRTC